MLPDDLNRARLAHAMFYIADEFIGEDEDRAKACKRQVGRLGGLVMKNGLLQALAAMAAKEPSDNNDKAATRLLVRRLCQWLWEEEPARPVINPEKIRCSDGDENWHLNGVFEALLAMEKTADYLFVEREAARWLEQAKLVAGMKKTLLTQRVKKKDADAAKAKGGGHGASN